jgi:hypothetical protein
MVRTETILLTTQIMNANNPVIHNKNKNHMSLLLHLLARLHLHIQIQPLQTPFPRKEERRLFPSNAAYYLPIPPIDHLLLLTMRMRMIAHHPGVLFHLQNEHIYSS